MGEEANAILHKIFFDNSYGFESIEIKNAKILCAKCGKAFFGKKALVQHLTAKHKAKGE